MNARSQSPEYKFECTRCNGCCGGKPGYVWLSEEDLDTLCGYTRMSRREFVLVYCKLVDIGIKVTLSLKEKQNYSCVFLGSGGCEVYEARPSQCRTYPFWESIIEEENGWEKERVECPGIGHGPAAQPDKISASLQLRRDNPPLDIRHTQGLEDLTEFWGAR